MTETGVITDGGIAGRTSPTLIEKIRNNDQEAWARLVGLYSGLVYHWCKLAGLRQSDAEEVGQEVFLSVARGLRQFDHDRPGATFRGWLWVIARRKIYDHAAPLGGKGVGGSTATDRMAELAAVDPSEEDAAAVAVEKNLLYVRAVELIEVGFEPKTRRAFWLLIAGAKPKDVAAELGITAGAVYTAKSRILLRLREEFATLLDLGSIHRPHDGE